MNEAVRLYVECERKDALYGLDPSNKIDREVIEGVNARLPKESKEIEEDLRWIIRYTQERAKRDAAKVAAQQRLEEMRANREREVALARERAEQEASQRQQRDAHAQAERDRAAAASLRERVEEETRRLEEAKRVAIDAEAERQAAEDALAKVRNARIAEEQRAQAERSRMSQAAEAFDIESKPVASRDECSIKFENFAQVRPGISLQKVEALLGCKGTLTSSSSIPGLGNSELYTWINKENSHAVSMQFHNKRLHAKSQIGLN